MGRIVRIKSSELKPLTKEEKKRIRELAKKPIVYDDDCPPLTDEQIKEIRKQIKQKKEEQKKEVLSIRVSKATMRKAKALVCWLYGIVWQLQLICTIWIDRH